MKFSFSSIGETSFLDDRVGIYPTNSPYSYYPTSNLLLLTDDTIVNCELEAKVKSYFHISKFIFLGHF